MLLAIYPRTFWPIPPVPVPGELIKVLPRTTSVFSAGRPINVLTSRVLTVNVLNRPLVLLVGPSPTTTFAVHR